MVYNGKYIADIFIYIILFIVIFEPMVDGFQFSFEYYNCDVILGTGITIK